ncbi:MAG: glycosyltransferase family 2 protein [Nanoarchaeota archaeon]|nr:glycosyltransferase family 2 protein [Nanoarchaeota archaeon]
MWKKKKVSVVFPAYNEEENIKNSIEDFFSTKVVDEIIVVDNNSKDRTASEVKKTKAKLVSEKRQGYGWANRRGLSEATGYYIITAEPDGTFIGKDVIKLLVYADDFEVVFGTRTSKELIWKGAKMNWFLRFGNLFVAKLLEYIHNGPCLTDVGCSMKLIKRDALDKIRGKFTVGGSHFSPEFMVLAIKNKLKCAEIPVNYKSRIGESKITSNFWKSLKLGLVMIGSIISYKFKK